MGNNNGWNNNGYNRNNGGYRQSSNNGYNRNSGGYRNSGNSGKTKRLSGATFTKYIPKSGRNAGEERYFISAWRKDPYTGHCIKCTCTDISGSEPSKGIGRASMQPDADGVCVPIL